MICMSSEVYFALEDETMEFSGVGTIKWIRFPEFGLGTGVVGFDNFVDSLGKCVASTLWLVVPEVSSGVSSSTGLTCADLGCTDDMFADVGGCNGVWAAGLEFPE